MTQQSTNAVNELPVIDRPSYQALLQSHLAQSNKVAVVNTIADIKKLVVQTLINIFAESSAKMNFLQRELLNLAAQNQAETPFDFGKIIRSEFGDEDSTAAEKINDFCDKLLSAIEKTYSALNDRADAAIALIDLVNHCLIAYDIYLKRKRQQLFSEKQLGLNPEHPFSKASAIRLK